MHVQSCRSPEPAPGTTRTEIRSVFNNQSGAHNSLKPPLRVRNIAVRTPYQCARGRRDCSPSPYAVHPPPDVLRPSSPDVVGLQDFCETDVHARSSLILDVPIGTNDPRNTSTTSSSGEATTLRKILLRQAQTNSLQQDFNGLVNFLKANY